MDRPVSIGGPVDSGYEDNVARGDLSQWCCCHRQGRQISQLTPSRRAPTPAESNTQWFRFGSSNPNRVSPRSQDAPLLSLRIVGPTSITSPTPSSPSRLKLKRLAPGLVELSSVSKKTNVISAIDLQGEATALLSPDRFSTLWPIVSVNGSNPNLLGFEALLSSVLDPRANKEGSFRFLKADVSAQTFVKIGFGVEKRVKEGEIEGLPEWRTKPSTVTMHFEVLAKVGGNKVVPEREVQVEPVMAEDSLAPSVLAGNVTMSTVPVVHPPLNPFTL